MRRAPRRSDRRQATRTVLHNPMRRSPRARDACEEAQPDPQPTLIGNWGMPSCGPTAASVTGGRRAELPVIRGHRVTELIRDLLPDGLGWIGRANALWTSSFRPLSISRRVKTYRIQLDYCLKG